MFFSSFFFPISLFSFLVENDDIGKIIESLVCDTKRKGCMFGDCSKCNTNRLEYNSEKRNDEINWCEWTLRNEKRLIGKKNEEKNITLTVKEIREGTASDTPFFLYRKLDFQLFFLYHHFQQQWILSGHYTSIVYFHTSCINMYFYRFSKQALYSCVLD
jgi:hypothetical protein